MSKNASLLRRVQGDDERSDGAPAGMDMMPRAPDVGMQASTAAIAAAEHARAIIQARVLMAHHRPRDMDDVRIRILHECQRPGFAAVARYAKPVGKQRVEGPSIRFVETALRCLGNADVEVQVILDDAQRQTVRVSVVDLETNTGYSQDVIIEKTVERKAPREGQQIVGVRENSRGERVYIVAATEDDLLTKRAALVSKAIRTIGLRIVPGDIVDECMDAVIQTQRRQDAGDPDAARKKLADAFAALNVRPTHLREYLGHDLAQCSPAELTDLRSIYAAIRDGETTWAAVMESRHGDAAPAASDKAAPPSDPEPPAEPEPDPAAQIAALVRKLQIEQMRVVLGQMAGRQILGGKDAMLAEMPGIVAYALDHGWTLDTARDAVLAAQEA